MKADTKRKLVPSGCETEEFARFDALLRNVLKVPKRDIQEREKKTTHTAQKRTKKDK